MENSIKSIDLGILGYINGEELDLILSGLDLIHKNDLKDFNTLHNRIEMELRNKNYDMAENLEIIQLKIGRRIEKVADLSIQIEHFKQHK